MEYKNLVTHFVRGWNFTRSETLELLESLNDAKLLFTPKGEKWQPLHIQFACLARTQMVYAHAITNGQMDFQLFMSDQLPSKTEFKTLTQLTKLLDEADTQWIEVIRFRRHDEDFIVHWPGSNMPLVKHIASLSDHERLHHGQLISYFTLAGFELPPKFKNNWAL